MESRHAFANGNCIYGGFCCRVARYWSPGGSLQSQIDTVTGVAGFQHQSSADGHDSDSISGDIALRCDFCVVECGNFGGPYRRSDQSLVSRSTWPCEQYRDIGYGCGAVSHYFVVNCAAGRDRLAWRVYPPGGAWARSHFAVDVSRCADDCVSTDRSEHQRWDR